MKRRVKGIAVLLLILVGVLSIMAVWFQTRLKRSLFYAKPYSHINVSVRFGGNFVEDGAGGFPASILNHSVLLKCSIVSRIVLQDGHEIITGHWHSFNIYLGHSNRVFFHIRSTAPVNFYLVLGDDQTLINATEITSLNCDFCPSIEGLYTFRFEPLIPPRHVATVTFEALLQGPQCLETSHQPLPPYLNPRT